MKKHKIIFIIIGVLYFLFIITATVYSTVVYQKNLTTVYLTHIKSGSLFYSAMKTGEVQIAGENGRFGNYPYEVKLFFGTGSILSTFIESGKQLKINLCGSSTGEIDGEITGREDAPNQNGINVYVGFSYQGNIAEDVTAEVLVEGESAYFSNLIPKKCVNTQSNGATYVNMVKEEDGPWGKQYKIVQEEIKYWPIEEDAKEIGIIIGNLDYPLVNRSDGPLVEGTPVRLDIDTTED